MAETKKPARTRHIIDVAHPGKSAPSGNSKSVIVNNRPLLQDPMVVQDTSAADTVAGNGPADKTLAKTSNSSTVKPLTAPLLETEEAVEANEPAAAAKTDVESAPEPDKPSLPDSTPELDKPDKDEQPDKPPTRPDPEPEPEDKPKPADPEEPKTDAAKPSKEEAAKQLETEANEQAEHQAAIDKLADSKKYYLPINTVEKRRSRRFVALGVLLSLLLIMAWADIALDAGLIHLGSIKAPTHFFSN